MARLRRMSDGEGFAGSAIESISWNEDGSVKESLPGEGPIVGYSIKVGSVTAGTYSTRDWWMTTPVTEILEEEKNEEGKYLYVKFKTGNSIYEMFA